MEQAITITFEDSDRQPVQSSVAVAELGTSARLARSLKALGLCWAIGAVCIFIPLAHFVLVPGFFLAGPLIAALRWKKHVVLTATSLPCPKCTRPMPLEAGTAGWPVKLLCGECSARLTLLPR